MQIKILHACTLLFVACAGASAQVQHEPISLQHPRAEAAIRSLTNEFVEGVCIRVLDIGEIPFVAGADSLVEILQMRSLGRARRMIGMRLAL